MEGSMKRRRDEQEARGTHDTIVLGGALESKWR